MGKPGLRLLTWNVRVLSPAKELLLLDLLTANKVDVAVITEVELLVENLPTLPGFKVITPSASKCIRVLLLVADHLNATDLNIGDQDVPSVWVKLGNLVVGGLYRQFGTITDRGTLRGLLQERSQLSSLKTHIQAASEEAQDIVILGDLNLDPSRANEPTYYRAALLREWCKIVDPLGITWAPTPPTFVSDHTVDGKKKTSTIDVIYSRTKAPLNVRVLGSAGSDHYPLLGVLSEQSTAKKPSCFTRMGRDLKNLDKDRLNLELLGLDWSTFYEAEDPETLNWELSERVEFVLDMIAPLRTFTTPNLSLRLSPENRMVMRERDSAKRKRLKKYRQLRNKALSLVKRDKLQANLRRIKAGGPNTARQIVSEISGKEKGKTLPLPSETSSDQEAAAACNEHYITKVNKLRLEMPAPRGSWQRPVAPLEEEYPLRFSFCSIGAKEVKEAVRGLAAKKSVGSDGIPITVFKAALPALTLPLVRLINSIIASNQWPGAWKHALITPVLKPGKNPNEVSSYRPVSLLCAISKIAEKVLYQQLSAFAEAEKILPQKNKQYCHVSAP